eukprot:c16229_g1_i1 orf=150-716(-)
MGFNDDEDDTPRLSAHTLAALQEFLSARDPAQNGDGDGDGELSCRPEDEYCEAKTEEKDGVLSILPEDWRLSQFWYDQHTAHTVAQELLLLSKQLQSPIACISCPSLYVELKSKECIEKTAQTMKLMAKDGQSCFLLLTGAVQHDHARDLLGARPCVFRPSHHNKLGNEFLLYTNYDPLERLGGWTEL